MKITTLAGTRTLSGEPRSTAYYYGDLERIKKQNGSQNGGQPPPLPPPPQEDPNELSEYVESNEIVNDVPISEVPPLRDRPIRQWSLPEYTTPEGSRKLPGETYSTAGTFPLKEKEPLLAELEVVGRLPLTQLETGSGVRRSRSWYLCCPNVGEEEISRESSWRYSSLRPVTAPPMPNRNGMSLMLTTQSSTQEDAAALKAERDALARTLSAERQRAAAAARAHDARLAELHGVIAELMRRRAQDKQSCAIPEEDVSERSDECESTTQPAGELDHDADMSRTDQNDTSAILSPEPAPSPPQELPDDAHSARDIHIRVEKSEETDCESHQLESRDNYETSLNLSERDSEICLSTARCCQYSRQAHSAVGSSCGREQGSVDERVTLTHTASPGRSSPRQAKLASRVRLRRTEDNSPLSSDEVWCAEAAEKLALDVCAQADLREALVAANSDSEAVQAALSACRARCARLEADARVLECAVTRATDTAHRLATACACHESSTVSLCGALLAADRALETYDVLLALSETCPHTGEREAAELVAQQLLQRLDAESLGANIGDPLLSPGPWLLHNTQSQPSEPWTEESEKRLRSHAARLKSETAALRARRPPPQLFSYHDIEEEQLPKSAGQVTMAEMEAAVMMQEVLLAREERASALAALASERARVAALTSTLADRAAAPSVASVVYSRHSHKGGSTSRRRERDRDRERHWLEPTPASETDL